MLERTHLFHDVLECLECGGVMLIAPRQVVIGNIFISSPGDEKYPTVVGEIAQTVARLADGEDGG